MQLVRVHQAGVRAFARGLLGDRLLAEDIAQEAFLRAWRGLEKFRGDAAFATWLYAIARRVALDEVRRPAVRTVPVEKAAALADRRAADPVLRGDLERALGGWSPPSGRRSCWWWSWACPTRRLRGSPAARLGQWPAGCSGPARGWPTPCACGRRIRHDRPRARAADAVGLAGRPGRPGAALPRRAAPAAVQGVPGHGGGLRPGRRAGPGGPAAGRAAGRRAGPRPAAGPGPPPASAASTVAGRGGRRAGGAGAGGGEHR